MHQPTKWITHLSRRGIPYQVLERQVPRIPDNLLHCVVYLYPSKAAAEDGERTGGSGFLVGVHIPFEQPPKGFLICVVTNKHVIDRGSMVVRINTQDGSSDVIALDGQHWYLHPGGDDIAVCPIGLNHLHHKFNFITYNQFATREILEMFDVGPGDDAFIPGRFIGRDGRQKNTPTVNGQVWKYCSNAGRADCLGRSSAGKLFGRGAIYSWLQRRARFSAFLAGASRGRVA